MKISHIDIKLTDGSTCVMNMDELPQVIQLSLKDTIFNWLLLRSSGQEVKSHISETTQKSMPQQAIHSNTRRRERRRDSKRIAFEPNYQDGSPVIPINGIFNLEAAINHNSVWTSMDTGGLLHRSSVMVDCRQKIIQTLALNGNKPLRSRDIAESLGSNHAASSRYISDLVYMGVLSKDKREKQYYISEWFINQIK